SSLELPGFPARKPGKPRGFARRIALSRPFWPTSACTVLEEVGRRWTRFNSVVLHTWRCPGSASRTQGFSIALARGSGPRLPVVDPVRIGAHMNLVSLAWELAFR